MGPKETEVPRVARGVLGVLGSHRDRRRRVSLLKTKSSQDTQVAPVILGDG